MKADRFWSEIGISQFFLDLFQFRFSMLWRTEPVPFGTGAIQIWTGSILVSLTEMRKWYKRRNRRMRLRKPSAITNIPKALTLSFEMAMYRKRRIGNIWYIGGKTIAIGSGSFSLKRVFSTHPAGNQSNWHNLASEAEYKERMYWSEQQELDTGSR